VIYRTILIIFHSILDWTEKDEDEQDVNVWEDNWDDDNVEDDFSKQLK
jgi:26 proteasome complex subunit DSS1